MLHMQFAVKISTVKNGFTTVCIIIIFAVKTCSTLCNYQATKITVMFSLPVAIGVVLYLQNTSEVKKECSAFFFFSVTSRKPDCYWNLLLLLTLNMDLVCFLIILLSLVCYLLYKSVYGKYCTLHIEEWLCLFIWRVPVAQKCSKCKLQVHHNTLYYLCKHFLANVQCTVCIILTY